MIPAAITRRRALAWLGSAWVGPVSAMTMRHEQTRMFGGPLDLLLPTAVADAVVQGLLAGLRQTDRQWNAWKPGELTSVNRAFREQRSETASPALRALISGAARAEALSGGAFNAAIGGLVGTWGFHADVLRPGSRPDHRQLARWRSARPSLAQVHRRGERVWSTNPGVQLDFGGYAKGVALDWAMARLQQQGVHHALLNLGGNLIAMGQANEQPWRVGIRDPYADSPLATLSTAGCEAVVTSGTYERWREVDGQRVTHIIDPMSAQPVSGLIGVTVVHPNGAWADAAATALLVAGPNGWRQTAAQMGVDQVLVLDHRRRCIATPRLAARLRSRPA
jgi:FAD:protein FMN transferase